MNLWRLPVRRVQVRHWSLKLALAGVGLATLFLYNNCSPMKVVKFDASSLANGSVLPLPESSDVAQGKILYQANCAGCHGALDSSTKLGRAAGTISSAIQTVPQMVGLKFLSDDDIKKIAAALTPAGNNQGGANPFACNVAAPPRERDLRRLSRREYIQTLGMLTKGYVDLSLVKEEIDSLPLDQADVFDSIDTSVTLIHIKRYFSVVERVATLLVSHPAFLNDMLNCSYQSQGLTEACWNNFTSGFAARVLRRPLTTEEKTNYRALYQASSGGNVAHGIEAVLMALLQSPSFLYKVEVSGSPVTGSEDLFRLSDYEIASRLAFLATGRGPDQEMMNDAAQGRLSTPEGYRAAVNRVFASPEAKEHVAEFFHQWMGANAIPSPAHANWFLGNINQAAVRPEALQELKDMALDTTFTSQGTYRDLLISEKNHALGVNLSMIYGVSAPTGSLAPLQIEGESMKPSAAGVGQVQNNVFMLWSNGSIWEDIQLKAGTLTKLTVRARASLALGIGAQMVVRFGNQQIASVTVSSVQDSDHVFSFTPMADSARFSIEFTNDYFLDGQDRNLFIDYAKFESVESAMLASLPAGQRPGITSRVGFLLSSTERTSLVHRGLIMRKHILCDKIGAPPIDPTNMDLFEPPKPDPLSSQRQQIEARTSGAACIGCHSMINPMGFVFENYDALGRFQVEEKIYDSNGNILARHPVNARVKPNIESFNEPEVNGLLEMAEAISRSSKGPACAAQQWFTYTTGRAPTTSDGCALGMLYNGLMSAESTSPSGDKPGTILNMMKTTAFESGFKLRKIGPK